MLPLPDILIWLVLGLAVLCCLARRTRPGMLLLGLALLTALWLERLAPLAALVSLAGLLLAWRTPTLPPPWRGVALTLVLLWFSFFFGMYNGAMVAALTEVMPVYVRTVGFSLAFSLATAIFGGLTPAISTALVELTGDKSAPGWWLMCAALCGFIATALLFVRLSRGYQPAESQR